MSNNIKNIKTTAFLIITFIALFGISSCEIFTPKDELEPYTATYFDSTLNVYLSALKTNKLVTKAVSSYDSLLRDVNSIYQNPKQLKWQTKNRLEYSPFITDVISTCENAEMYGFSKNDYPTKELNTLFDQVYTNQENLTEEDIKAGKKLSIQEVIDKKITLDVLATQTALTLMHDIYFGRMEIPKKWDLQAKQKQLSVFLSDTTKQLNFKKIIQELSPKHPGYFELCGKLQEFQDLKKNTVFPKVEMVKMGDKGSKVKKLAERLTLSNDYNVSLSEGVIFNKEIELAIRQFQSKNGIKKTGTLDKKTLEALNKPIDEIIDLIKLNLERYRWLPEKLTTNEADNYVFVNIPEYHIRCYRNGEVDFESIAVVGETITPTPVFHDLIEFMVFSPVWVIPASIAREEIFQYALINPAVLIAGDTEVYYKGKKVNPYSVDWKQAIKEKHNYSFWQKPTDQNSMGDVKFKFPNKHGVYLHDTPIKKDFKLDYRAKSSGCVRVGKPAELAEYLLKDKKEDWTLDRIKRNMNSSKERRVNMEKDVPVYIYYFTAWVDEDGDFRTAKDIYKHDKRQLPKLKEVYK